MSTFCQCSYHRKFQRRGVGGQKSQNLINIHFPDKVPPKALVQLGLILKLEGNYEISKPDLGHVC